MGKTYDQHCPIAMTLDLIGDRWTLLILRDLAFGHSRFNELLASSSGMSTKILSERLKLLESHGLIERTIYSEHPLRAEYHLTPLGLSLEPVLMAVAEWGLTHLISRKEAQDIRGMIDAMKAARPAAMPAKKRADAAAPA
ncbi:MAG: helix-turn-helix transcriptional regulator [Chloroflexi bacterium]|nr:helix-turn-helix transcriptional regulator [Chloroflexota bacterium]